MILGNTLTSTPTAPKCSTARLATILSCRGGPDGGIDELRIHGGSPPERTSLRSGRRGCGILSLFEGNRVPSSASQSIHGIYKALRCQGTDPPDARYNWSVSPLLSIIIPTHKRADILRECLQRIEKQTIADQLEVIVVSDGPDLETKQMIESTPSRVRTRYFEIPKSQQGIARNRGVDEATADRVLFIGDDIFLEPDACEKHIETKNHTLKTSNSSVLGFTTWDPAVGVNDVMRWLEQSGWQFGYPTIGKFSHQIIPSSIQQKFTYTSHVSLPTEIAKKIRFREDVTLYGWEDIEWGKRLKEQGVRLFYEPDAKALHHHHIALEQSLKRMETLGQSAVTIEKVAPDLHVVPKGWKKLVYEISGLVPTLGGKHRKAFLRGLKSC